MLTTALLLIGLGWDDSMRRHSSQISPPVPAVKVGRSQSPAISTPPPPTTPPASVTDPRSAVADSRSPHRRPGAGSASAAAGPGETRCANDLATGR